MRKWATRNLRSGDLTALAAIVSGCANTEPERVNRLSQRGFVVKKPDGRLAATIVGRTALAVRRFAPL